MFTCVRIFYRTPTVVACFAYVWDRVLSVRCAICFPFAMSFFGSALVLFFLLFVSQVTLCDGRLVLPNLGVREWKSHDVALKTRLQPIHSALSADAISPSEAASEFSASVADFLGSIGVFKGGGGGGGGERGGDTDISDEAFLAAKREKKRLQRLVFGRNNRVDQGLRAQFYQAVKALSFIKRAVIKGSEKEILGDRRKVSLKIFGPSQKRRFLV